MSFINYIDDLHCLLFLLNNETFKKIYGNDFYDLVFDFLSVPKNRNKYVETRNREKIDELFVNKP